MHRPKERKETRNIDVVATAGTAAARFCVPSNFGGSNGGKLRKDEQQPTVTIDGLHSSV
jgi:hypothetical protein